MKKYCRYLDYLQEVENYLCLREKARCVKKTVCRDNPLSCLFEWCRNKNCK